MHKLRCACITTCRIMIHNHRLQAAFLTTVIWIIYASPAVHYVPPFLLENAAGAPVNAIAILLRWYYMGNPFSSGKTGSGETTTEDEMSDDLDQETAKGKRDTAKGVDDAEQDVPLLDGSKEHEGK